MEKSNVDSFITKYPNVIRFLSFISERKIQCNLPNNSLAQVINSLDQIIAYYSMDQDKTVRFVLVFRLKSNKNVSVMDVTFEKLSDGKLSYRDFGYVLYETENFILGYLEGLKLDQEYRKAITDTNYKLLYGFPLLDKAIKPLPQYLTEPFKVVEINGSTFYYNLEKKNIYSDICFSQIFYSGDLNENLQPDGTGKMYLDGDETWFGGIFKNGEAISGTLYYKEGSIESIQGQPNSLFKFSKAKIIYREGKLRIFDGSLHLNTELPHSGNVIYSDGDQASITVNLDSSIDELSYTSSNVGRGYTFKITRGIECKFTNCYDYKYDLKLRQPKKLDEDPNELDVIGFQNGENVFDGILTVTFGTISYIKGSLTGPATYEGSFENNKPQGNGTLKTFYGQNNKVSFIRGKMKEILDWKHQGY